MYKVSIFNNDIETIVHYPTADKEAPHLLSTNLKESLSKPEELSFVMLYNNPGYSLIEGLKTKVKIFNTTDNSIVFTGRVIPTKSNMNDGAFNKEIICEGALAYLNDTNTRRWNLTNKTPTQILTYLLDEHNSKVDDARRIQLGIVEITQPITIDTNYETTLNAIITKIRNILGGDIKIRESNGVLYLDYLKAQGNNNEVKVSLGYNLKDMIVEYDPLDIVTRVIPLGYGEGINQLGIKKVNNGIEYIEDSSAISKYGIIEGIITNKDMQNPDTLKKYGETVLNEKKQMKLVYSISALDLSVLSGHENEKYELGDTIHTLVDIMNIDVYARVVERNRDLINSPWEPTLTISTRPITLTNQIINLKQRNLSLENAPQGNTVIFPISKAENADSTHPITLDLDIPKETININRVYINLHGRKYRADSKDVASGGSITATSSSGGGSTATSSSGGGANKSMTSTPASDYAPNISMVTTNDARPTDPHKHFLPNELLAMIYEHTHKSTFSISSHTHSVSIPSHTHKVDIPKHTHAQNYGIVESTYPKNVRIKVNGNDIGVKYGSGSEINEYNIDITKYVIIGNNKVEISTEQNGRIDCIIYSQIFIQSK